jgi:Holliday junction resolvase RusA-like endonuclease
MPVPKGKKRSKYPLGRPDIGNVIKGPSDVLNGVIWKDDSQIVTEVAHKHYGAVPGLHVAVYEVS